MRFQNIIIVFCLYFAAYASLASDSLNSIALYIAMPIAFALSFLKNKGLRTNKYENMLLLLFGWIFISYLWANYSEAASRELHRCLGSILLSYVLAVNAKDKKMLPWLYLTFLVLYLGAWNYAQNNIIIDLGGVYDNDSGRMNDEKLNANTMAYYTFYVSFLVYLFGEFLESKRLKIIFRYLFWTLFPISFIVALVTASRQVLIIQVPLLAFMLYNRYWKGMSSRNRFLSIIIGVVAVLTLFGYVESAYENSYLAVRAEKNLAEDARTLLMKDAFNVGIDHMPLGVGAGNYIMYSYSRHFSHVSYLELFANQGIVGLVIFIWLLFSYIKAQWRRYKDTKDKNHLLFFVFGLIFAFDNIFYVFYLDLWLISFFILVASHSITYSKEQTVRIENGI